MHPSWLLVFLLLSWIPRVSGASDDKAVPAELEAVESDFKVSTQSVDGPDSKRSEDRLKVLSWKLRKDAAGLDLDRMTSLMANADLSVFQNVEFGERGETILNVLTSLFEKRTNETVCRAWFKNAKGRRAPFGMVWRDRTLSFVDRTGRIHQTCPPRPLVSRSEAKNHGNVVFLFRANQKLFILTDVWIEASPKRPETAMNELFGAYAMSDWPVLFAGDFRLPARHSAFRTVRKWSFSPAVSSGRGTENFWSRNLWPVTSGPVNFKSVFPDLTSDEIEVRLGSGPPIQAEFSFSERELAVESITRKTSAAPVPSGAPLVMEGPSYPAPLKDRDLSDLQDDLEGETHQVEPPPKASGTKRKRRNR